eukprot:399065_1
MRYLNQQHIVGEILQLKKWLDENEYDTESINDDVHEHTYEGLTYKHNTYETSNIAETLNKSNVFNLILQYIDAHYFNHLLTNGYCELADTLQLNKQNTGKKQMDNYVINCGVIDRILFMTFKHNQQSNINGLIDILKQSEYQITDLMNDIYHFFNQ